MSWSFLLQTLKRLNSCFRNPNFKTLSTLGANSAIFHPTYWTHTIRYYKGRLPHNDDVEDSEGEDWDEDVEDGVEPQNIDIQVPVGPPNDKQIQT